MRIRIKLSHFVIAAVLSALIVTACGGGGGGFAGIGGSGYISSGTVTSFGSVFVNGVEFETGSSTFDVEDNMDALQGDLRIGMVVQVSGSINADGVMGTATHIKYGDDLEGPVSGITPSVGVDSRSFTIFGKTVVVFTADTVFEGVSFAGIADGNVLEVSGYYDQNGTLQASYIELKSNASNIFEIKGPISSVTSSTITVRDISINVATAIQSDLPNGLQINQFVEVKGTFSNNVFIATEIEGEDDLNEEAEVEIEGIVTRFVSNSDFDVNDQRVNATNAIFSPAGLTLKAGIKLEVEGRLSNGVLIASEVEIRGGSARVSAKVASGSIDTDNNRFAVEVLPGQLVTVQLTSATLMEDDAGNDDNLLLSELIVGDFVNVRGFESASDTITATRVKRESEVKETELQGVVTAESANEFRVLGVTYPVDIDTSYEDANEGQVNTNAEFLDLTTLDQTVISIKDDAPVGVADEVEIED